MATDELLEILGGLKNLLFGVKTLIDDEDSKKVPCCYITQIPLRFVVF